MQSSWASRIMDTHNSINKGTKFIKTINSYTHTSPMNKIQITNTMLAEIQCIDCQLQNVHVHVEITSSIIAIIVFQFTYWICILQYTLPTVLPKRYEYST